MPEKNPENTSAPIVRTRYGINGSTIRQLVFSYYFYVREIGVIRIIGVIIGIIICETINS